MKTNRIRTKEHGSRSFLPIAALFAALGCGSAEETGSGGRATTATGTASSGGSGASSAAGGEGATGGTGGHAPVVSPACTSPSGFQLCYGANHCPPDVASCSDCVYGPPQPGHPDDASLCYNDAWNAWLTTTHDYLCGNCTDGEICWGFRSGPLLNCAPFEVGVLYAQNGDVTDVHYADRGQWTGEPLPTPSDCPTIPGVPVCGGACGDCPAGTICTGRSPLHPYSMCVPEVGLCGPYSEGDYACSIPGSACFFWKVQPDEQPKTDGVCMPLAQCQAAAQGLPGGGYCRTP